MKKIRFLFKIILLSFIGILIGVSLWISLEIYKLRKDESYKEIVKEINDSKKLPDRFYPIYERVTGFNQSLSTSKSLFKRLELWNKSSNGDSCPCILATYTFTSDGIHNGIMGLALDGDVTPLKCIDLYLSRFDFLFSISGIENASRFYYHKELNQLSEAEMMELSVMTLNPSYYNKLRFPKRLRNKMLQIQSEDKI